MRIWVSIMFMLSFPKDRNCEICKRTKITRAPCRRRNGEAVPRAVNFGDLMTADHKVLSDKCESRNNHRYAVVVHSMDPDFKKALSTLYRLKKAEDKKHYENWSQSSSSWWQWQTNWWESDYENSPQRWSDH